MPVPQSYIDGVYQTLKTNVPDFKRSPQEFSALMNSDANYRGKIYQAFKMNIPDFKKTPDEFYEALKPPKPTGYVSDVLKSTGITDNTNRNGDIINQPSINQKSVANPNPVPTQMMQQNIGVRNEAIKNTIAKNYEKQGIKFDENSPQYQKDFKDLNSKVINRILIPVPGRDGQHGLARGSGLLESFGNAIKNSVANSIEGIKVNSITNGKDFEDYLKERDATTPNFPESAPTGIGGDFGNLLGSVIKPAGLSAIPYVGRGLATADAYITAEAKQKEELFKVSLKELEDKGMPHDQARELAFKKANDTSQYTALPDAAVMYLMTKSNSGALPEASVKTFGQALDKMGKSSLKMGAIGGTADLATSAIKKANGYDVSLKDALNSGFEQAADWTKVGLAFDLIKEAGNIPKYVSAAAKELVTSAPPEVQQSLIENAGKDGEAIKQKLDAYSQARAKVEGLVPEEHLPSIAGLTEKQDGIQKQIDDLNEKKKTVPAGLHEKIDEQIDNLKKQSSSIDEQIKVMANSPNAIDHEIDTDTGEKAGHLPPAEEEKSNVSVILPSEQNKVEPITIGAKEQPEEGGVGVGDVESRKKEMNSESDKLIKRKRELANDRDDVVTGEGKYKNFGKKERDAKLEEIRNEVNDIDAKQVALQKELKVIEAKETGSVELFDHLNTNHGSTNTIIYDIKNDKLVERENVVRGKTKDISIEDAAKQKFAKTLRGRNQREINEAYTDKVKAKYEAEITDEIAKYKQSLKETPKSETPTPTQQNISSPTQTIQNEITNEQSNSNQSLGEQQTGQENGQEIQGEQPEGQSSGQESNIENEQKINNDAIQEQSAGSLFQHSQEGVGKEGSERTGMESGEQGQEATTTQPQETAEEKVTGIKKSITEPQRVKLSLPSLDIPKLGKDTEILQRGKDLVESGEVDPVNLVGDINSKNKALNADEASALQYYMYQLGQQGEDLRQTYYDADKAASADKNDTKAEADRLIALDRLNQHNDQLADALDAAKRVQNTWGKVGNVMQVVADKSYNPVNIRKEIEANYGGEMPEKVQQRVDAILKERDEAVNEVTRLKAELEKAKAEQESGETKKTATKKTKDDYKKERDKIVQNIKDKWNKAGNGTLQSGIPFGAQVAAIAPDVLELFKSYASEGFEHLSEIIDKIHSDINDAVPISKKDINDIIANSEAERLNKVAEKKEGKLASGDINPKPKNPVIIRLNNELVKAQQRLANVNFKIRNEQRRALNSQISKKQRALAWLIRWNRRFALSGINVTQKIATAGAIGDAATYPIKEGSGWIWSKIFPSIAKGAPTEGGINAEAMANYYKRLFNLKKNLKNAKDIYTTGSTDLSKKLKEETYEHYAGFDALMDTHSVLKDPFKEAEFQSAVTKTTNWVAKNTDWDLSDPLVTKFIETIAFKKANEAIFNEQNDFVNRVRVFVNNNAENKIKKIGAAEFIANMLMPVGKVPTNIVKQLGWGVYGIPKGLLEARKVLKEGIENATPEQKDHILKLLKAGTLGNALLATGALLAYSHFGGMYNQFDKSKRKQDDVKTGESKIGGTEIPKYAEHALPMQLLQSGATMRRIYDYYRSKHEKIPQAIGTAIWGTGFSLISEIPFVNLAEKLFEAKNPYGLQKEANSIAAMAIPQMLKEYAKSHDVDANGNPIVRKPKDIVDAFKYNIPGLRQEVPEAPVKYLDKADIDKPAWKYLTEHGIELPKTNPDKLKFKNENGKEFDLNSLGYTDKQKDDFAKLRTDKIEEKINAAIKNNLLDKLTPEQLKKRIAAYEKMATLFAKNSVRKQIQESKK